MTLFEYLSVATSIVLSLSAAQLLSKLRPVLDPARRYWVHALWTFVVLLLHLNIWWEFWGYREVVDWNFAKFSLMLLNPGILFVCSSMLVNLDSELSQAWDNHFFDVRRPFFAMLLMLPIVSVLRRWVLAEIPILSPENFAEIFLFIPLYTVACIVKRRRFHAAIAVINCLFFGVSIAYIWFQPGAVLN